MTEPAPVEEARPGRGTAVVVVLAVVAFVVAGVAGALVDRGRSSTFRSAALLSIDQPLVIAATRDAGPVEKLSRLRLQYAGLLRTDALAVPIAEQVGSTPGAVSGRLSAFPVPNSLLVEVAATGPDAGSAQRLATAAANALVGYAEKTQTTFKVPTEQMVVLQVVTEPRPGSEVRRGNREVVTVGVFLGLAAAALVLGVASLVRRRR